jgi:hypothetical protein
VTDNANRTDADVVQALIGEVAQLHRENAVLRWVTWVLITPPGHERRAS